jgi:hypothetical protein
LWADYLARRDPHYEYLQAMHQWFPELEAALPEEIARRFAEAEAGGIQQTSERGSVWTYVTTDQPFGSWTERVLRGVYRKFKTNVEAEEGAPPLGE